MTIRLEDIRKTVKVKGKPLKLFDGLNLSIEPGARVGILGLPRSGKSTLLGMICGSERIYTGNIVREMSSSWPIPFDGFFAPTSSVAWGLRSVARLYGVQDSEFASRVASMAQASAYVNSTSGDTPAGIRFQIAYVLGLAIDFDLYLFDNAAVSGMPGFKGAGKALLAERTAGRAIVVATSQEAEVAKNCQSVYVLASGKAVYFADVQEGIKFFKEYKKSEEEKQKQASEEDDFEKGTATDIAEGSGVDSVMSIL